MNAYVIGFINALIPGLGYLVVRRRMVFASLLILSAVVAVIASFFEPAMSNLLVSTTPTGKILESITLAVILIAFGIDGYNEARSAGK
jgi:hypothetical protein